MGFPSRSKDTILSLKNISFSNKNHQVLTNVNFMLRTGEVHAIVGEHRAGKTPLIKIICGELKQDSGSIVIRGNDVDSINSRTALEYKIGVVHQDPQIIPNLDAIENIIAGTMPPGVLTFDYMRKQIIRCRQILEKLECHFDIFVPVSQLSLSDIQLVEVARVIYNDPEILIFDDIGSRLNSREMKLVISYMKEARSQHKAVIFIDSNIDNVLEVADRVTILHQGMNQGTELVKDLDRIKLLKLAYNFVLSNPGATEKGNLFTLKEYNEKVISNLPAGVLILNTEDILISMNKAARKILAMGDKIPLGKPIGEIFNDSILKDSKQLLRSIRAGEVLEWDKAFLKESQVLKIKTMPYYSREEEFQGTIILLEDNTMDLTVKEYLVRAEKISSIAELAAGVSHEINNPLAIIKNYLQVLKYKNLEEDVQEKLDKIEIQVSRISEITTSLLSFSRFKQLPESSFDLIELFKEIILLLGFKINKKKINIEGRFPAGKIMVKGSENRLRQVFVNLINNSIEAVETQHGEIMVSLDNHSHPDYAKASIRDNGHGIPLDIQESIFSPFFTTKLTKQNGGLGLSICQHIVEMHNGMITFKSAPGEYTEFVVQLPKGSPDPAGV